MCELNNYSNNNKISLLFSIKITQVKYAQHFSRRDAQKPFFRHQIKSFVFFFLSFFSQSVCVYAKYVRIYLYMSLYFYSVFCFFLHFFVTVSSIIDDLHIDCECERNFLWFPQSIYEHTFEHTTTRINTRRTHMHRMRTCEFVWMEIILYLSISI